MNYLKNAITAPEQRPDEAKRIVTILEAGWDGVHIRLPNASLKEVKTLIETIPQKYHDRLWLHGHFELVNEFNLGGLHLNSRCPQPPANYTGRLSRACHTVEEVTSYGNDRNFSKLILSPIFDSISKKGYPAKFSDYELLEIADLAVPVIALGGVTPERIDELSKWPFSGYAVLGYFQQAATIEELKERIGRFENS
ncbi:MAG: thiamine phosphate synthase [Paramuribaculum sp.]|nr:thiamine phosphate synthase [Paramuribaculum sp.]